MPSFPTNLIHQICFSVTFLNFLKIKFKLKNTKEEIHCDITPESRTTTTNIKIVQRSMWRWAWIRTLSFFYFYGFILQILVQMKYESVWVDLVELDILLIYYKWGRYTQINQQMYFANYYNFRFFRNHWVTSIEYTQKLAFCSSTVMYSNTSITNFLLNLKYSALRLIKVALMFLQMALCIYWFKLPPSWTCLRYFLIKAATKDAN